MLLNLQGEIFIEGWESRSVGTFAILPGVLLLLLARGQYTKDVSSAFQSTIYVICVNPQVAAPQFEPMTLGS